MREGTRTSSKTTTHEGHGRAFSRLPTTEATGTPLQRVTLYWLMKLNCFFVRFEVSTSNGEVITPSPVCNNSHMLTVQEHELRWMLSRVNPMKTAGSDGVTGRGY